MDSSVSPKAQIWFLRVCHHISNAVQLVTGISRRHTVSIFSGHTVFSGRLILENVNDRLSANVDEPTTNLLRSIQEERRAQLRSGESLKSPFADCFVCDVEKLLIFG
jgi:hypothetical protein